MLIEHLPISGNNPPVQLHNENRQRAAEFRLLAIALDEGDVPGAKALVDELLRQNAPNTAQSAQKQREFGHSQSNLNQLAYALEKNDVEGTRKAFKALKGNPEAVQAVSQREEEPQQERDDGRAESEESTARAEEGPSAESGSSLDALA